MITQQVAAFLIKKMAEAMKDPNATPKDPTAELFQYYFRCSFCEGMIECGQHWLLTYPLIAGFKR